MAEDPPEPGVLRPKVRLCHPVSDRDQGKVVRGGPETVESRVRDGLSGLVCKPNGIPGNSRSGRPEDAAGVPGGRASPDPRSARKGGVPRVSIRPTILNLGRELR